MLATVVIVSSAAFGQQSQSAVLRNDLSSLITLKFCEQGVDECAIWTLNPAQHLGSGQSKSGQTATLSYTINKDSTIMFQRADTTGSTTGLIGTYTGTIDQDGLSGTFKETLPGKPERTGHWYASAAPPISLPKVVHFCAANCFTLTWFEDHYENTYPPHPPQYTDIWKIETFTRPLVVIHRHAPPNPWFPASMPNGFDWDYRAQISGDGDTLVNFIDGGQPNPKLRFAWGAALHTVPGSNEERDALNGQGQGQLPAAPVCDWNCVLGWGKVAVTGVELAKQLGLLN